MKEHINLLEAPKNVFNTAIYAKYNILVRVYGHSKFFLKFLLSTEFVFKFS